MVIKKKIKSWIVSDDYNSHRVDYWLKKIKPNLSYPIICKIIRKGLIKVNKRKVKNSFVVHAGDRVNLFIFINELSSDFRPIQFKHSLQRCIFSYVLLCLQSCCLSTI